MGPRKGLCHYKSAALSIFIIIKGIRSLLWGRDTIVEKEKGTVVVLEQDAEAAKEDDPQVLSFD
jgi:hypothetical protein